mgnify:FL=1
MGLIDFALFFLYEDVYAMNALLVGIATMAGKLSAGIFQFIIPWISDHTKTRWGRRKPYLLIMAPILAVSFIMLLLPGLVLGASPDEMVLFGWFVFFNVIAQASYAMTTIYHSWTGEQFPVDERPKVSQYQNLFNFIALAVTTIFSMMVLTSVKDKLIADPTTIPPDFLYSIIVFAIIMIVLVYICAFYMPKEKTPESKKSFREDFRSIIKNKNFQTMVFIQALSSLGWAMINAVLLGFATDVIGLEGTNLYIAAVVLMTLLMVSLLFWRKKIESAGKKKTLLIIFAIGIIGPWASLFGISSASRNIIFGILYFFIIAVMQAGWALFPYIIYADLAEDAEKAGDELKTGLFMGYPALILNIFQAISLFLTGWLLDLPEISNGGEPFSMGMVLWGPLCAIFFVITYLFIKRYVKLDFDWEKSQENEIEVTLDEDERDEI